MSLGFDAIAALPFATSGPDTDVTINVSNNTLTIGIGNPAISADSITEVPDPNRLTLGIGTLTITADANVSPTGSQVVLNTGTADASTSVDITPSDNQLTLSTGSVTITADANIEPTGVDLTLATGEVAAITWSEIIPGVTMVWTPIDTN